MNYIMQFIVYAASAVLASRFILSNSAPIYLSMFVCKIYSCGRSRLKIAYISAYWSHHA